MNRIVSTKILSPKQRESLAKAGFDIQDYDAISIHPLEFELENRYDHYIFTSQNAVKTFLEKLEKTSNPNAANRAQKEFSISINTCFCVGQNTKRLLEENGLKVLKTANNASELADFIIKKYKNETFLFLCGKRRRHELPDKLRRQHVRLKELVVYDTHLNPEVVAGPFEGVLFYSPSGAESFFSANSIGNAIAYCIGHSTANLVRNHTTNIQIAPTPSTNAVLSLVISQQDHGANTGVAD